VRLEEREGADGRAPTISGEEEWRGGSGPAAVFDRKRAAGREQAGGLKEGRGGREERFGFFSFFKTLFLFFSNLFKP
jgi:hypothetical protein